MCSEIKTRKKHKRPEWNMCRYFRHGRHDDPIQMKVIRIARHADWNQGNDMDLSWETIRVMGHGTDRTPRVGIRVGLKKGGSAEKKRTGHNSIPPMAIFMLPCL